MQARRLAKRPSLGSRRGGAAPAPAPEAAALGLPPPGPSPAAAPGSWRPPLPPRGTGPSRAAAASSPVLLLLGEEDEDEEGAGRRRRTRGRVTEKPRGVAEEEDDDEEEDEEVVVEVVDGDEDDEDAEERFVPLGPGRALPKGPARGAVKVRARCRGSVGGAAGSAGRRGAGEAERSGAGREGCVRRRWAARGTAAQRLSGSAAPGGLSVLRGRADAWSRVPVGKEGALLWAGWGTWELDEVGAPIGLALIFYSALGRQESSFSCSSFWKLASNLQHLLSPENSCWSVPSQALVKELGACAATT